MKLTATEVGHGINVERYEAKNGKRVVIIVSTQGNDSSAECHYTVLDSEGLRSGIIYDRDFAMKLAESKVL